MQEDRINDLEGQLAVAEAKIQELFKAGKVPGPKDYTDLDRLKKELKTARRLKSMDETRIDPKLTRKITIQLSEDEFQRLTQKAHTTGENLSSYIRKCLAAS